MSCACKKPSPCTGARPEGDPVRELASFGAPEHRDVECLSGSIARRALRSTNIFARKELIPRFISKLALLALLPVSAGFASPDQTAVFDVQNMTCAMCKVAVKKAFQSAPGVEEAMVDYEHKTATVKYDPAKADRATLAKASTDAGFPATPRK